MIISEKHSIRKAIQNQALCAGPATSIAGPKNNDMICFPDLVTRDTGGIIKAGVEPASG